MQYRFDRVKRAARHESNVPPEMPGFGGRRQTLQKAALAKIKQADRIVSKGQIVASVTTFLTVPPKGLVKGSGPEERLARAAYFVQVIHLHQPPDSR
eukprot:scaffold2952_cov312-Pinguiococcus_pyrenoidosus.AAC.16